MKLHLTNAEVGMWNAEGWSRCALSFFKIDRIHHFDIRHSLFDIRFFRVSFPIRLDARGQRRRLYETSISKIGIGSILGHFAFVGWVEPTPGFVGFRCTQPNLHCGGVIAKCVTQQRPFSEPSPKSFYFD